MATVVVYDSGGGIWIWIGGIWQRWWNMAAVVVYGSGGGIRQHWRDMAAVVVYGNNDEDAAAAA